ncbi:MAG TPA: flagellar motor switch protein FliN [Terriglobales bacterium]|nr:flagellar motor switch protein FliN [Terriglobales bacterium]
MCRETETKELACKPFLGTFATSASAVLSQALGTQWNVEVTTLAGKGEDPVTLAFGATGGIHGEWCVCLSRTNAARLSSAFMMSPETDTAEWTPALQDAAEELFRQIAGDAALAMKPLAGEVKLQLISGARPEWEPASEHMVSASTEHLVVHMTVRISPELLDSLRSIAPACGVCVGAAQQEKPMSSRNLDLLMDVDLGATLRFGRKVMPLRDILELTSGSVIELDRQVHEPVDLLIEGKLVARGEVVIVEGNYGLRVTEVASPQQKMAVLR